jgi:hypothetical protein
MPINRDENPSLFVTTTYEAAKQWRAPYEERWKRFYKLYRSWRDVTITPFKSNIFVPYIFAIVESITPKMLGTIFNVRPILSVIPRKGAAEGMSVLLERLLEYQLDEEQLELFNKIMEFFKETVMYGTSFAKVIPKFNDDEIVSFNYIDIEPLDIFNVFPDYRAKSVRRMKYIIHLSYVDYDELQRLYDQGFYENVPELLNHTESMATVDSYKKERLSSVGILDEYGFDSNRQIVEILEYWDRDKIIVVGARNFVLKIEDNPFQGLLPFIMARYIPVPHELYGIGIPEVSENLQEELNSVRNQRMDNVNLIINRMWIANKYADIDFDNMVSYPGNVILSNDINAIKSLDTRDVTKSAYVEESIIKKDIDDASGESLYSRGGLPERRETATGIVRLQQASNIRFDTVVKMLEFTVLRAMAKMFIWLDYHFLPPEEFARIVGIEEFQRYNGTSFYQQDINEILKQYNFQPMGSSTTAIKEVRIQQLMQAYKLFNQDPAINQLELRKMVLDVLDIKNINRLLKSPEQIQQEQQQALQQKLMLMQMENQLKGQGTKGGGKPQERPGGPGNVPNVPPPGSPPVPAVQQMQEMSRVAGGGLLNRAGLSPQPVSGQAPGVSE